MRSRVEQTIKLHDKGYNCAQSVLCTYCDLVGLDRETAFKIGEGLGKGLGNMEGSCGALTAACVLAGFYMSSANLEEPDSKQRTYAVTRDIVEHFQHNTGTLRCREIRGEDTGTPIRSCPDCIRTGARLVEMLLHKNQDD